MKKSIIAVLAATCMLAPAAWSQEPTPPRQTIRYFVTPLEKDPTRTVEMVSIAVPPGAGNEFHRHSGDQWTAVQEGEVTFTIKGQPPFVLRAGEGNYVAHRPPTTEPQRQAGALRRDKHSRQGQTGGRACSRVVATSPAAQSPARVRYRLNPEALYWRPDPTSPGL